MSQNLEITNIKAVFETRDKYEVNRYLSAGWKVLATETGSDQYEYGTTAYVLYSLGWFNEDTPIYPKNDFYSNVSED